MESSYRSSHAGPGYGERYSNTYRQGYYHEQWNRLEKPLLQEVFGQLASGGISSCMDFACGTGRILSVAEGFFPRTVGVDVSEEMLKYARQTCQRSELHRRDIIEDPLSESFDMATAFRFFVNAEQQLRESALGAIARGLKPGGVLVANVHVNARSPLGAYYRLRNAVRRGSPVSTLGHTEFSRLLELNGFRVEKTYWYSYLPRVGWHLGWLSRAFMEPVERVARSLAFLSPGWAQSFLIVARKV